MIRKKIRAFYKKIADNPHHRYRSWEHCYRYFHRVKPSALGARRDRAALHLAFYLASWGMYRGSTFLLQHAYTVHLRVVDCIASSRFARLWECEFGSGEEDEKLVPLILEASEGIREVYSQFSRNRPSDVLVTKVLLGTIGCLPAFDQYFKSGFRRERQRCSSLNARFVKNLLAFSLEHLTEFRREQAKIQEQSGVHYPLMKLLDMYFWQIGFESRPKKRVH